MVSEDVDLMLYIAKATINFQQHIVDALTQYKETGNVPNDLTTAGFAPASPKKRGKKPKLNKDGSEKQPRKPTAYNAWMQAKLKELKEAADHDPEQKHVETFKQAANIWAALPKEEKDRITAEFKEKHKDDDAVNGEVAGAVVNAHAAAMDEDDSDDEEDEAPKAAAPQDSSSEESSDEEEPPAPALKPTPKPAPAPAPAPAAPPTDGKKKKRKPAAEPAPVKPEAPAAAVDAGKPKKKKKKKDTAA